MYGVIRNSELIAIHDDLDVINSFVDTEENLIAKIFNSDVNNSKYDIVLISKKKSKYISKQTEYEDLYLIQCSNGQYVPKKYKYIIELSKEVSILNIDDLIFSLITILQSGVLSHKKYKHVLKSAKIIAKAQSKMANEKTCLDNLKMIYDMDQEYKEKKG